MRPMSGNPKLVLGMGSTYIGEPCPSCGVKFKFGDRVALVYRKGVLSTVFHDGCVKSFGEEYAKEMGCMA